MAHCDICGRGKRVLAGEPAHPSNWYCEHCEPDGPVPHAVVTPFAGGGDLRIRTLGEKVRAACDEYGPGLSKAAVVGVLEMVKQELIRESLDAEEPGS